MEKVKITFDERNPNEDVFKETDLRARKLMTRDGKMTYQQACHAAWRDDPDLHRAYLSATPPIKDGR